MTLDERPVTIDAGGLRLEGRLHDGPGPLAAVVVHPHPQYGGDMHNHVVAGVCETLAGLGATTLRFNTRGTGRSEGSFDRGHGEVDDVVAAAAFVRALAPERKLVLAGYSFGAMVLSSSTASVRPAAAILISPPAVPEMPQGLPILAITGDRDGVAPPQRIRSLEAPGRTVAIVPGADHGWWPGLDELLAEVDRFARSV